MTRPHHLDAWDPLYRELDAWQAVGATAQLWLRDDDATQQTPALETFARLTSAAGIPAVLAVIPALAQAELATYLASQAHLDIAVHGYAHTNHAAPGAKKEEFPFERGQTLISHQLARGLGRLRELFGKRTIELYVPPWNRISPASAGLLQEAGYTALSAFGPRGVVNRPGELIEINTHVDIIDWRGTRGGRDTAAVVADVVSALRQCRLPSFGPAIVGVLSHHLVHDAAAWRLLEELLGATAHPAVVWRSAGDLIAAARTEAGLPS